MERNDKVAKAGSDMTLWALAKELAADGDEEGTRIAEVCSHIFDESTAEAERLAQLTSDLEADIEPDPSGQLHLIEVSAQSRVDAQRFVSRLQGEGYVGWQDFEGAAAESFFRHESQATLVRLDGTSFTVIVRWSQSSRAAKLPPQLRPTAADHEFVDLPGKLWPAYVALRPIRLVKERLAKTEGERRTLGPILSTPESLLDPLFDFAQLDSSDHLIDLGCGEGRVVIAAAERRGCRATGVERDPRLVARAKTRLEQTEANSDLVRIVGGDAEQFSVDDASVVFLFIPAEVVANTVSRLRREGFEGRIISHEQRAIRGELKPSKSTVLLGTNALTVAHLWA